MTPEQIARISELTRISRSRTLTEAEQTEREQLRALYRQAMRRNLQSTLDNTDLIDEQGNRRPLQKRP